jgi:hypothetical protein
MEDVSTSLMEAIWLVKLTEVVNCSNAIMDRYVEAYSKLRPMTEEWQCVDGDGQPSQKTCEWNTEDEEGGVQCPSQDRK